MKDCKKKVQKSNSWIFLFLICLATCFMGIGYARIDIILEIAGNLAAEPQDNIFITEVNYVSNVGADLDNSEILDTYQTNLTSEIVLSTTDANSKITYEIKIYNIVESPPKVSIEITNNLGERTLFNSSSNDYNVFTELDAILESAN